MHLSGEFEEHSLGFLKEPDTIFKNLTTTSLKGKVFIYQEFLLFPWAYT